MGGGEQAAAALRTKLRRFRERGEVPAAVGYGLPTALIVLALFWPFLYGVVPSRAVWKSTSASGAPDNSSLSHFSAMTRTSWLGRAVRKRHRHAIEQASRR